MKKYKVCVYAICKNEEQFIERWFDSMKEADSIYVLDTGSIDNSVDKLKSLGVNVYTKKIEPWRFDIARNESLKLLPNDVDICVCTDLDEVFINGWREQLEKNWDNKTTRLAYTYNWFIDKNNNPKISFYQEKIHSRHNYKWTHPVHEVLTYIGNNDEVKKITDDIVLNHYPDNKKSRNSYLPLLELSVKEDPEDDRNMHYLGREYMYYGQWDNSINTLINHLKLPKAIWKDERCASMRFIARCYKNLNRIDEAKMWLDKAILEAPYLRDPYIERAILEYNLNNWDEVIYYTEKALNIKYHAKNYINETFSWDHTPYDLLSIAYFNIGKYNESLLNINIALTITPDDKRLINNKKLIEKKL